MIRIASDVVQQPQCQISQAPSTVIFHILKFCPPECLIINKLYLISKNWYQFFHLEGERASVVERGKENLLSEDPESPGFSFDAPLFQKASPHLRNLSQVYFAELHNDKLPYSHLTSQILLEMTPYMFFSRLSWMVNKERASSRSSVRSGILGTREEVLNSLPRLEREILQHQEDKIHELGASLDVFQWYFQLVRDTRDSLMHDLKRAELQLQEMGDLQDKLLHLEVDVEDLQEDVANKEEVDEETTMCCICMEALRSVLILPCKHFCICDNCEHLVTEECPLCRSKCESKITSIKM